MIDQPKRTKLTPRMPLLGICLLLVVCVAGCGESKESTQRLKLREQIAEAKVRHQHCMAKVEEAEAEYGKAKRKHEEVLNWLQADPSNTELQKQQDAASAKSWSSLAEMQEAVKETSIAQREWLELMAALKETP